MKQNEQEYLYGFAVVQIENLNIPQLQKLYNFIKNSTTYSGIPIIPDNLFECMKEKETLYWIMSEVFSYIGLSKWWKTAEIEEGIVYDINGKFMLEIDTGNFTTDWKFVTPKIVKVPKTIWVLKE